MSKVKSTLRAVDEFQQRRAWLAFPVAVWKKFGDDQAGNLALLVAWFAFVSIFPLMLVLVTVLDIVLKNNQDLQHQLLNSALSLSTLAGGAGHLLTGFGATVAALLVSLVLNIGVFWLAFRLGTAAEIGWRQMRLAAVISGVIWQVLQAVGGYFVSHQLAHASPVY